MNQFQQRAEGEPKKLKESVSDLLDFFSYEHLPIGLKEVSKPFHDLAQQIAWDLDVKRCSELLFSLRKLLESKDCAVRSAIPITRD